MRSILCALGTFLAATPILASSLTSQTEPSLFQGYYPHSDQILDSDSPHCRLEALKAIGWKVSIDQSIETLQIYEGNACNDENLEDSNSQGDLNIKTPSLSKLTESEYLKLVETKSSLCGFKQKVEKAAKSATTLLRQNPNITFGATKFEFLLVPANAPWKTTCLRGECFSPNSTPSDSLDYLLRRSGKMRMECAAGVQTMKYALIRELYGETLLDESFGSDEFMIGTWGKVNWSNSSVFGKKSGERPSDPLGINASQLGRIGLAGIAGYIGNLKGEAFLDSPNDRGENFMIVSTTIAANQAMINDSGLTQANEFALELWELSKTLKKGDLKEFVTSAAPNLDSLGRRRRENIVRMREILAYPVFTGILVQVHPLGLMTFAQHLTRLLKINPRTPYEIKLYADHVNAGLYRRFLNDNYRSCLSKSNPNFTF